MSNSIDQPISNQLHYTALENWEQLPHDWSWIEATSVAVDSRDNVFVFNRSDHPVIVFDRDGRFIRSWGEGKFARAHGITIGPDDAVYLTDDLDHTVKKYTPDGECLMTLGTSGKPADTGATSIDYRTIVRSSGPFYFPTNVALGPEGEIYVADGYGNARVHKFSEDGRLLLSWGTPGDQPGQFHVPHGIAVDRQGNVLVADRENNRLQLFSPSGHFLWQMRDIARPCQIAFDADENLWVAELGYRSGMWPGTTAPSPEATGGRVTVFNRAKELIARFGGGENPTSVGDFYAPHDICVDSQGSVYVAEVVMSAGGNRGEVDPSCHSLQKFVRLG